MLSAAHKASSLPTPLILILILAVFIGIAYLLVKTGQLKKWRARRAGSSNQGPSANESAFTAARHFVDNAVAGVQGYTRRHRIRRHHLGSVIHDDVYLCPGGAIWMENEGRMPVFLATPVFVGGIVQMDVRRPEAAAAAAGLLNVRIPDGDRESLFSQLSLEAPPIPAGSTY